MKLRDRIKDFRRIEPSLIRPNPRNWRTHPDQQKNALRSVLADVGIVDAVLVRELADGSFMLVDGHLRAETITSQPVPALVLDIDETEEAEILATFDPLGDLAGVDLDIFKDLVSSFEAPSDDVRAMLDDIAKAEQAFQDEADAAVREAEEAVAGENDGGEREDGDEGDETLIVDVHDLRAPFPWFGGKSRAASIVWGALGDVPNYVEPFFGSGAVLLARPGGPGKIETINDLDRWVANFWRASSIDPEAVAKFADWPVNECDLHARHKWLLSREEWKAKMQDGDNPDFFDARIAGWWVWGLCAWIGSGWCAPKGDEPSAQVPHLSGRGQGIHGAAMTDDPGERLPHLGNAGRGVHRGRLGADAPSEKLPMLAHGARGLHAVGLDAPSEQLPHLQAGSRGKRRARLGNEAPAVTANIIAWMQQLRDRMRRVRVACGSWERVLTPAVTTGHGLTGVFLDPPYAEGADDLYGNHDKSISAKVRAWAIEHGDDPLMRIAFCGYAGEHTNDWPKGWRCVHWKAQGGYGSGNGNPYRERIWLSPHCLAPAGAMAA